MTRTPYDRLPPEAFWKSAIAEHGMKAFGGIWSPKFEITAETGVATYGSCFAQHISRALKARGCRWIEAEVPPYGLPQQRSSDFGYGIYSARTANIYTPTMLAQWTDWATGRPAPDKTVWESDGRYFDPFRPGIEPGGFFSRDELLQSRGVAVDAFRRSIERAGVFVFTLGLTERWVDRAAGFEYAQCPGVSAGTFDESAHAFDNLRVGKIIETLRRVFEAFRDLNPALKVLLTVSPVPLTATAAGRHVLVSTVGSKSILRTAAGDLASSADWIDYFPSYEIVTNTVFGHRFYSENRRSVTDAGVAFVMKQFFAAQKLPEAKPKSGKGEARGRAAEVVCEEELLESFGGTT